MKTTLISFLFLCTIFSTNVFSQNYRYSELHGRTFNIGFGLGGYSNYYNHLGHTLPVMNFNYEFDVVRNLTLAPFLTLISYSDNNYRTLVLPIGLKGTLYLDNLLRAGSNWDFYAAGSLGFSIVRTTWDANYYGDRTYYKGLNPLYLDFHLGTEYHFSNHFGVFLDLSTGFSSIGLAIR